MWVSALCLLCFVWSGVEVIIFRFHPFTTHHFIHTYNIIFYSMMLLSLVELVFSSLMTYQGHLRSLISYYSDYYIVFVSIGIDKVSVGRTDFFANHLVTNADALRIAEQGELFLQAAKTTATR